MAHRSPLFHKARPRLYAYVEGDVRLWDKTADESDLNEGDKPIDLYWWGSEDV